MSTVTTPAKIEKNCQNCQFHTQGIGAVMQNGTVHIWQDCSKNWGKPQFIGVIKNLCQAYKGKT